MTMALMHYHIRRRCLHWLLEMGELSELAEIPLAWRLSATLRVWDRLRALGEWTKGGRVEWWSTFPTSNV